MESKNYKDFSDKINFLYTDVYNSNIDELVKAFSDNSNPKVDRKKSIKNWLNGKIKKPNKFEKDYNKFPISKLKSRITSETLPLEAFKSWSLEEFKETLKREYIKTNLIYKDIIKYLYIYDYTENNIVKYNIEFSEDKEAYNEYYVVISNEKLQRNMYYRGKLIPYQSMYFFELKNDFDFTYYVFENFADVYVKDTQAIGIGLTKDYNTRKAKAYLALISSTDLDNKCIDKYRHILNRSNTLFANFDDEFKNKPLRANVNNILKKLYLDMKNTKNIDKIYNDNIATLYTKLFIKSFNQLKSMSQKVYDNDTYYINLTKERLRMIFDTLVKEKVEFDIICEYSDENSFNILKFLIDKDFYDFNKSVNFYLLVSSGNDIFNDFSDLRRIADTINLHIVEIDKPLYSFVIQTKNKNIVFYKEFNIQDDIFYVSIKNSHINKVKDAVHTLKKRAKIFNKYIEEKSLLLGTWYIYALSSKNENKYNEIKIEFDNSIVTGSFVSSKSKGYIQRHKNFLLITFDNTVIKIDRELIKNTKVKIFEVGILSHQAFLPNSVATFGIMSNVKLKEEDYKKLLNDIYHKELSTNKKLISSYEKCREEINKIVRSYSDKIKYNKN